MVKCHESRVHASICANRRLQLSGASVSGMEVHDSTVGTGHYDLEHMLVTCWSQAVLRT